MEARYRLPRAVFASFLLLMVYMDRIEGFCDDYNCMIEIWCVVEQARECGK